MAIKTEEIRGLRKCPVCGYGAVMRKNASKRFQVHCKKCKACSAWTDKAHAIIDWYNMSDLYERIHGRFDERSGNITPSISLDQLNERIKRAVALFEEELRKE